MTKIIDNTNEKLASELSKEFYDMDELAIASAYFNVHGFGSLKDALMDKPLLFLLGREPTETIKWEEEVLRELEEKEDDMAYFTLLQDRSEEHTSELQSHSDLVCRLLLEKKKKEKQTQYDSYQI